MHISLNISRSKGNKTLKLGQEENITRKKNSFKNHAKNEGGKLVSDLVLFFKNVLYEVKASSLQLSFNIF